MIFLKKLHKWVGLLIGIQVLLWLLSGLMLSLLDAAKVSGEQWARTHAHTPAPIQDDTLLEPAELAAGLIDGALEISLEVWQGQPVYRLSRLQGITLIDAKDGAIIVTDEHDAQILAQQDFTGTGEVLSIRSGHAPDMETRGSNGQYWQVNFSDPAQTSIYILASTGEILERRNTYWRTFDFFWMLHIMDYAGHDNINNVVVIAVALVSIWLGISGFILLFASFNRHDFYFLNILGQRNTVVMTLIDPGNDAEQQIKLRKGSNLFLSLAQNEIALPSSCGGGGECGKCRVKIETIDLPEANSVELSLVPKHLREQGYRLACQQEVINNSYLYLPTGTLGRANIDVRSKHEPV